MKRGETLTRSIRNALSEIGEEWIKKYVHILVFKLLKPLLIYEILTSLLDVIFLVSQAGQFFPRERNPGSHWREGWGKSTSQFGRFRA